MANNSFFKNYRNGNLNNHFSSFFKKKNILTQIILINLIIFLITSFISIIYWLFQINPRGINSLLWWVALPAEMKQLMQKPWSIFTYMFVHEEFMHFLINMLWFYWFGQIFQKFLSITKILGTYIVGGIAGALLFMLAYNFFPVFDNVLTQSLMIGASASITAIVFTVSFYRPNYRIGLFFIGRIKLKYISLIILFFDIIAIGKANTGGHIAHIGGAVFGLLYGYCLKNNYDPLAGFHRILQSNKINTKRKKKVYNISDYDYKKERNVSQDKIDKILDKISQTGYESLTQEEKKALFDSGK